MRKLYMRQVVTHTSTYSSDEFGVCSALFELGGMVVMHDASGCNSTYTTHDEPRWYETDSMIFISAISEMEAIMGDDRKFIEDLTETAKKLKPEFIALVGAPIPYMTGTDFPAIARIVQKNTGIPAFGFQTNGMEYYTAGISMALREIADRFCVEAVPSPADSIRVNLLGATPLDFSVYGWMESIRTWLSSSGFEPGVCFAMGSSLEEIRKASSAQVNLVLSRGGLEAALLLNQRFGIPYVVGVPFGKTLSRQLADSIRDAAKSRASRISYKDQAGAEPEAGKARRRAAVIGESVQSASLAAAIELEFPELSCRALCPLDKEKTLLREKDLLVPGEEDVIRELKDADLVIADPLYQVLCPGKKFFRFPHTAFSGRIWEREIPDLTKDLSPVAAALL